MKFRRIYNALSINWKYALGEVSLIVIGILIALYINTLQTHSREREFERKILLEMKRTLDTDAAQHYAEQREKIVTIQNASERILEYLNQQQPFDESLNNDFWVMS